MTTFRIISTLGLLIIVALVCLDIRRRLRSWMGAPSFVRAEWRNMRSLAKSPTKGIDVVLYLTTVLLCLVLAITGFASIIVLGEHMTGTLLIIHVTVAPLFALSLAGVALLWANRLRIDLRPADQSQERVSNGVVKGARRWFWLKFTFWSILVLSLPLLLSIVLGMYPLFGTDGEELLINVHGYSALLLSLVVILQTFLVLMDPERTPEHLNKEDS